MEASGAITGRVQSSPSGSTRRFTLIDLGGSVIVCHVGRGWMDLLRDLWGARVTVYGLVTRDRASGRPLSVRQITAIERRPEPIPDGYQLARGAVPTDGLGAVDAIRMARDDW